MAECPECRADLKPGAKSCRCGWKKGAESGGQAFWSRCSYCQTDLQFPTKSHPVPNQLNRLVGRSKDGGWICRECYRIPCEPDYRDDAIKRMMTKKAVA